MATLTSATERALSWPAVDCPVIWSRFATPFTMNSVSSARPPRTWIWSASVLIPACCCRTSVIVCTGRLRISFEVTLRTVEPWRTSTRRRSAVTSIAFSSWTTISSRTNLSGVGLPAVTTTPGWLAGA